MIINENYFTKKFHINVVLEFTDYDFEDMREFTLKVGPELEEVVVRDDFLNSHYYGIFNLMYELC